QMTMFHKTLDSVASHAPHIQLKQNDDREQASSSRPKKPVARQGKKTAAKRAGGSVNIAIGDDGISDLSSAEKKPKPTERQPDPSTIEDVTQLIRQKLQAFKSL